MAWARGDPAGRPEHIKVMLDGLTEKAPLEEALNGDDAKLKLTAAQEVPSRALGKPSVDVKAVDNSRALVKVLMSRKGYWQQAWRSTNYRKVLKLPVSRKVSSTSR